MPTTRSPKGARVVSGLARRGTSTKYSTCSCRRPRRGRTLRYSKNSGNWSAGSKGRPLHAEESRQLDRERAILQFRKAAPKHVAAIAIDNEEIATWAIFPSQPRVDCHRSAIRVVLHQRTD